MKIIYKYLFKKFLGPFALIFFFALFILLMQFLWKYVDDLVGKGLEISIVLELLFYASATCVYLALPLAVLLSSLMTFGSLGEQYEIIAMKSAGIPVKNLIFSLSFVALLIAACSFWFADQVTPKAYIKMRTLLRSINDQKPALSIEEGVFYNGFDNFVIRVGKKGHDNATIYDVMIYDHSKFQGNTTFTYAKSGKMIVTEDQMYMMFYLYNGFYWDESNDGSSNAKFPLMRSTFSEQYKRFDISSFKFERNDGEFYSYSNQALSNAELIVMVDSASAVIAREKREMGVYFANVLYFYSNFYQNITHTNNRMSKCGNWTYDSLTVDDRQRAIARTRDAISWFNYEKQRRKEEIGFKIIIGKAYEAEWWQKLTLSLACLLLFFIGAPLGSIVRKGGIAIPLVITVLVFSSYFMFFTFCKNIAREGAVEPWLGMCLPTFILLPLCLFLTIQASRDSGLLSIEEMQKQLQMFSFKKLLPKKKR